MILRAFLVLLLCLTNLGAASAQSSVTFSDYPRYGTDVNALHPNVQAGMKAFATGLVGAALAGQSVDVTVIGHADFDAKGREFEVGVSRERAAGAESALETFFAKPPMPRPYRRIAESSSASRRSAWGPCGRSIPSR